MQTVDAGDHVVSLGEVESAELSDGAPLVYFGARYRKLRRQR